MIFVDSDVPMYLMGGAHPNRDQVVRLLPELVSQGERLVTNAEVLQEVLHRYQAMGRIEVAKECLDLILDIVEDVFPIEAADVLAAVKIAAATGLAARDALHVNTMRRYGIARLLSFDSDFDRVDGIDRLS